DPLLIKCVHNIYNSEDHGEKYAIKLLKKFPNLDINAQTRSFRIAGGKTALMVALNDYPTSGAEDLAMACESVVKLLINRGAKIDLQDNDEETALMKAVMYKK